MTDTTWTTEEYRCPLTGDRPERTCPKCNGTGRIPGHLGDLVKTQPVTFVSVTDRRPLGAGTLAPYWVWYFAIDGAEQGEYYLPFELRKYFKREDGTQRWLDWKSEKEAQQALSDALLAHAKQTVTPPTPQTNSADTTA